MIPWKGGSGLVFPVLPGQITPNRWSHRIPKTMKKQESILEHRQFCDNNQIGVFNRGGTTNVFSVHEANTGFFRAEKTSWADTRAVCRPPWICKGCANSSSGFWYTGPGGISYLFWPNTRNSDSAVPCKNGKPRIGGSVFQTNSPQSVQKGQKNNENGERAGGKNERTSKTPKWSPQANHPKWTATQKSASKQQTINYELRITNYCFSFRNS